MCSIVFYQSSLSIGIGNTHRSWKPTDTGSACTPNNKLSEPHFASYKDASKYFGHKDIETNRTANRLCIAYRQ